jgi:hypothetical protein
MLTTVININHVLIKKIKMPNKYYYLVSSLAYLEFEKTSPVTKSEFLSECKKWLDSNEFKKLTGISINNIEIRPEDAAILKDWKVFDRALREELGEIRKMRKKSMHEKIPSDLMDVFDEPTPLLMERTLEKKRWNFIEEKEFGYHFDINTLILYFLKLQILERLARFDEEKGRARFERVSEVAYA